MKKVDLLIKNGKVYTEAGFQDLDVAVSGEKIAFLAMPGTITNVEKTVDAAGKHVLPGMVDAHTHVREPGYTHKEDFETASKAAAAGGVTMIFPQPNLAPVPNTVERYRKQIELGESKSLIDFNPAASPLLYEDGWVPKLAAEGTAIFKIFQRVAAYPCDTAAGTLNTVHIYEAFKEVAKTGKYCAIHPHDHCFHDEVPIKVKKAGLPMTIKNYLSISYTEEECMVGAAYEIYYLAKRAGMKWYMLHCARPGYIDLARLAKSEGKIDVVASWEMGFSCLTEPRAYDVKRKELWEIPFPLPAPDEMERLWAAVNDGTIDFVASEHGPHLREELMANDPLKANLGIPVLDWYGHLLLNEVNKGNVSLEKLVKVTSVNPAKIFGLYPRKGAILPGSDADLIICDLKKAWTITSDKVYTKIQWNPHHGRKIKGKVTHTILRGEVIMEEGEVIGKPGHGKFIPVY